jgi:hypothetical protein
MTMSNRRYLTSDPERNAQEMLSELDAMYYGMCRLLHDHDALTWPEMGSGTKAITAAALVLMDRFPSIESQMFNREWYTARKAHFQQQ